MENSLILFLLSLYYYTCSSQQVGLPFQWHSFDRLLESCIQTSSVKANFSVGVTRTIKDPSLLTEEFSFPTQKLQETAKVKFFPCGRKNDSWMESWACSVVWQAWDMHDLGSHRLHIYIERTLSTLLCVVLR